MGYYAQMTEVNDAFGLKCMTVFFCSLTILSVILRFYARRLTRAGLGLDDWFAFSASVFVLALNANVLGGTIKGAYTGHSPIVNDRPVATELEHLSLKYKYGFQITEKVAVGLIKLSILFLWRRIFGTVRSFAASCWVMIGVIVAWSSSFFFATLFQCGTNWVWNWAPIDFFKTHCTNNTTMVTFFIATDILTDLMIMFMPIPIIWKLHMPRRKKAGVTGIFMLGLL
ncbi:hypothetical protein VP1G_11103 [Cytospora mali]|uniref:Rhodopsin domain-containing protein n=1 Tax=Cytospora mali TaxID=578113 RepID=A0A194V4A1_CYTMA|nr:hypothetical protein VP1G_11103 [Valsa mali var. pyri (nom. inval.)]